MELINVKNDHHANSLKKLTKAKNYFPHIWNHKDIKAFFFKGHSQK